MATLLLFTALSVGGYLFWTEYWLVRQEQMMERQVDRKAEHDALLLEREAQLKELAAERAAKREAEREEAKEAKEE